MNAKYINCSIVTLLVFCFSSGVVAQEKLPANKFDLINKIEIMEKEVDSLRKRVELLEGKNIVVSSGKAACACGVCTESCKCGNSCTCGVNCECEYDSALKAVQRDGKTVKLYVGTFKKPSTEKDAAYVKSLSKYGVEDGIYLCKNDSAGVPKLNSLMVQTEHSNQTVVDLLKNAYGVPVYQNCPNGQCPNVKRK